MMYVISFVADCIILLFFSTVYISNFIEKGEFCHSLPSPYYYMGIDL